MPLTDHELHDRKAEHRRDAEPDAPDWNGKLYVANSVGRPYPLDRMFWVVTDQGEAVEVAYDREATFWLPADGGPYFSRQDGEAGCWGADELVGWCFDQGDAEEAAALFLAVAS